MPATPLLSDAAFLVVLAILVTSLALLLVRLVLGPGLADRAVALDTAAFVVIGLAATLALATGQSAFLDVALVVGLVAFLATVAFGRHIERTEAPPEPPR